MNPQIAGSSDTNSSTSTNPSELEEIEGVDGNSAISKNQAIHAVLNNPLIVSEILGHLDFPSLKQCRLVNKFWEELVVIKLGPRTVIKFCPRQICWNDSLEGWALKFAEQAKVLKKLKIRNMSLDLYCCKDLQVTKDICWVMDNFGDQFRSLRLEMEIANGRDAAVFFNILNRLRELKEIELFLHFKMDWKKIKLPTPLETVQSLKINDMAQYESNSRISVDPSLILKLFKVFPNVEKIKLEGYYFMTTFLSNSLDDGGFLPFRHLKTLDVELYYEDGLVLKLLQRIEKSQELGLEILIIRRLCFYQPVLDALMGVLKRHATTLKSLHLTIHNFGVGIGLEFIFPPFPKLKKLVVWNYPYSTEDGGDKALWHQVFYKNDFPLLEDLDLTMKSLNCQLQQTSSMVKKFFEAFVPLGANAHENTCVTMKRVKFSLAMDWENDDDQIWGRKLLESCENMFPNAILTPATFWSHCRVFKS